MNQNFDLRRKLYGQIPLLCTRGHTVTVFHNAGVDWSCSRLARSDYTYLKNMCFQGTPRWEQPTCAWSRLHGRSWVCTVRIITSLNCMRNVNSALASSFGASAKFPGRCDHMQWPMHSRIPCFAFLNRVSMSLIFVLTHWVAALSNVAGVPWWACVPPNECSRCVTLC